MFDETCSVCLQVMASSMIGLTVGESGANRPPSADVMLSPAQTETGCTGGVSRSASSFPSHGYVNFVVSSLLYNSTSIVSFAPSTACLPLCEVYNGAEKLAQACFSHRGEK